MRHLNLLVSHGSSFHLGYYLSLLFWIPMFIKFLALPLSLFLLLLNPCFAQGVQVSTNEPKSKHLGMTIDLAGRDFVGDFPIVPGKSIFVDKDFTDVRIKKDTATGFNKFYALVAYNLHVTNAKPSAMRFLYLQCPVTRTTYIDRSPPFTKQMINGEMRLASSVIHEELSKEFLDAGSYAFLSSAENKVPPFSKTFPMSGKMNQTNAPLELIALEAMCLKFQLAYAEYSWSETFRKITLKDFGISE